VATVRDTVAESPPIGAMLTVDLPVVFAFIERLWGFALIVKSGLMVTGTVTLAKCESWPLLPVTVAR